MKKLSNFPIYIKLFISLLISLIIPLLILGFIMYSSILHLINQETDRYSTDMLSSVRNSIDLNIVGINNIAFQLGEDRELWN